MDLIILQLLSLLGTTVFLTSVLMHIVRRNSSRMTLYLVQSFAVAILLFMGGLQEKSLGLFFIAALTFFIKVVFAGIFFSKIIDQKQVQQTPATYLNLPTTLGVILGLTMLVRSSIFAPVLALFPVDAQLISLALAGIFISLFLVINRHGAFAQLIGILSLENGLVVFSILVGLEQAFGIEVGILFNILVWIFIASALVSLVYSHFGSFDTIKMRRLKD